MEPSGNALLNSREKFLSLPATHQIWNYTLAAKSSGILFQPVTFNKIGLEYGFIHVSLLFHANYM